MNHSRTLFAPVAGPARVQRPANRSGNSTEFLAASATCAVPLLLLLLAPAIVHAQGTNQLSILNNEYPRVFFFRNSEQACNARLYPTFASWDAQFNRLQGIMGKCLDEECLGREPRNIEFFSRFKQQHPDQVVLLHFNGNARDPRYHTQKYFPGHWIYRSAVMITADVPSQSGESVIKVKDTSRFRMNAGRFETSNDDIALLGMTADGKHDWYHCEQVQLIAVDPRARTIRVKRGCYGTKPLAFRANASRAAAHQVEGPWGRHNNIMWFYNHSALCPKDKNGRNCNDLLVDDLAEWFGPAGKLAAFDGIEFDVMFNQTHGDTDGDGLEEDGVIDGINQYGIGMIQLARQLRQRMGDQFVIQGDGALGPGGSRSQRAWHILNGIESEGWPNLNDWEFDDWSGGLNRHFFWRDNAYKPVFNYVNHKWVQPVAGRPGVHENPDVPFSRHRLAFAACQFFDAAVCYSFAPRRDADGKFGVWDEFRCGVDNQLGWLGRPEGPAVHLAAASPDLLQGHGEGATLAKLISGAVKTSGTADSVRVEAVDAAATTLRFTIQSVPTDGPDLYVKVVMQGQPRSGYPREMARFAQVGLSGGMMDLMAGPPRATGMKLRGARCEVPLDRATGARLLFRPATIAGEKLAGCFAHPPYKGAKGYVYWEREVDVPRASQLCFSVGMGEKSPERSDGVQFQVYGAVVKENALGAYQKLFETTTNRHQWLPQTVSLAPYAGQRVRLKFVADCGPHDNATTDQAYWGAVKIVTVGAGKEHITPFKQYMTWVNDRPFRSGFYYSNIKSGKVDLAFNIEGSESVVIQSVTAHAHCDVMIRLFQRGIVLANPSHEPYKFDLTKLAPNRKYRRLQGTVNQDALTNNGQATGATVTVGPRDGLFLRRVDR